MPQHKVGRKRAERRKEREQRFGPERTIVHKADVEKGETEHVLSCGHRVPVHPTELPHIKRRRCLECLPGLQREKDRLVEGIARASGAFDRALVSVEGLTLEEASERFGKGNDDGA